MAAQERCLFWWLFSFLLIIKGEELGVLKDVKFISQNFHNVLHWKPGNRTENGTMYFVQHQQYGNQWSNKPECWGIRVTCCDLTQETNPYSELFFARVRAFSFNQFSDWTQSETFCPMTDTLIGPPETEVICLEKSILVKLTAPLTFLKKQNKILSIEETYFDIKYNIILSVKAQDQIGLEHKGTYITKNKTFEIQHLSPGTTYCISVRIQASLNENIGVLSKEQCVKLAEPSAWIIQSMIICSAAGTLVLVTLSIYIFFKYNYTCVRRPNYPAVLTSWNKKEQENVVFLPHIIEQTDIDKWEFTKLSKLPSTLLSQNKSVTKLPCKRYINIESQGIFQNRVFDPNSMPLDIMTFGNYCEIPNFTYSDYVNVMVEFDSLLSIDKRTENSRISKNEEKFKGEMFQAQTEFFGQFRT